MYFLRTTVAICCTSALLFSTAFGDNPPVVKERFALSTTYLQSANFGIYESIYNTATNKVFSAVIDKVNKDDNVGFINVYDPQTLELKASYAMPYRVFSLTQSDNGKFIYAGHTQSKMISKVDAVSGKVLATSKPVTIFDGALHEHFRHMVYAGNVNKLYVTSISIVQDSKPVDPRADKNGVKIINNLLIFNADTLAYEGKVEAAYPSFGVGLTFDKKSGLVYTTGDFINVIDPHKNKVIRSFDLTKQAPEMFKLGEIDIDNSGSRLIGAQFRVDGESYGDPKFDGVYVFSLKTGKKLAYIKTGDGVMGVKYNPKFAEIYAANFRSGTISIIDANSYKIKKTINPFMPFPNLMLLSPDLNTLYVGLKQGFSRDWNPEVFISGAKEQLLKINLLKQ